MEETRKSPNKKMQVGGGIGAVLLLAAAALASVFAVRRSSGEDSSREIKKSEDNITREGGEEVGVENDSTAVISDPSLKLDDDKAKCESEENDPFLELIREDVSKDEGDGEVKGSEDDNIGEETCVEKTILAVFEEQGSAEMVGVDDVDEKKRQTESKWWKAESYDEVGGKMRVQISCSCFFQRRLSFAKLAFFLVFITLFLFQIYGFSLLHHSAHHSNKLQGNI